MPSSPGSTSDRRTRPSRDGPPDGFPKLPDLPSAATRTRRSRRWRTSSSSTGSWLYAAHDSQLPIDGQLSAVRRRRRPDPAGTRRRRQRAGVPQRLPPSRRAGRAWRVRHRPPVGVPVPLVELRPVRPARASPGRARLRRAAHRRARPATGPLRTVGWLVLRQPRRRSRAPARLARPAPATAPRSGRGAATRDRREAASRSAATGRSSPRRSSRCTTPARSTRRPSAHRSTPAAR